MRTTILATSGVMAAAVVTLVGAAGHAHSTSAAQSVQPQTHTERGIVLECTGQAGGLSAYVNLYENDVFTNYVQVILDDDPQRAASREPGDLWSAGRVSTSVRVDGRRARITGTATKVGRRTQVREELDDAGHHVVSAGWHRRLENDLTLTYAGTSVDLTCDPAFFYKLEVTKTPSV